MAASQPGTGGHANLRIVKLGGAAITVKAQFETLDVGVLNSIAGDLASCGTTAGSSVIVHGAGSFGHFQAKQYGVALGGLDLTSVKEGFALTRCVTGLVVSCNHLYVPDKLDMSRLSVTKLNHLVVTALTHGTVFHWWASDRPGQSCSNSPNQLV
jgi:hypothetical protein